VGGDDCVLLRIERDEMLETERYTSQLREMEDSQSIAVLKEVVRQRAGTSSDAARSDRDRRPLAPAFPRKRNWLWIN